ncbi:MAG: deoxyribose-phosphate aldolase [Rickettsiales bacterium]
MRYPQAQKIGTMGDEIDLPAFDAMIDRAREKFRALAQRNPALFGGSNNPRLALTINEDASRGTIAVPQGIDVSSTQGLMQAVDLTELKQTAIAEDIKTIAAHAHTKKAATVCVRPEFVALVKSVTDDNPPPIAVVGFPFVPDPTSATQAVLEQTRSAIEAGAREIDMVLAMNFKDGTPDYAAHYDYIRQIVEEASKSGVQVKVILETAYLSDEQKVEASMIAKMAGATFVKTSTGFARDELMHPDVPLTQKGATVHDVALMRRTVGDTTCDDAGKPTPMGVKASGGVRTREQAIALYEAGASRIGASGGIDLRTRPEARADSRNAQQSDGPQSGLSAY